MESATAGVTAEFMTQAPEVAHLMTGRDEVGFPETIECILEDKDLAVDDGEILKIHQWNRHPEDVCVQLSFNPIALHKVDAMLVHIIPGFAARHELHFIIQPTQGARSITRRRAPIGDRFFENGLIGQA
jgi:hypothetical protein